MARKIGVFDSGSGGLTVVAALHEAGVEGEFVYFADTAHLPYGERPLEEVKGFALGIIEGLVKEEGCEAIASGCNISSAVALEEAKSRFPEVPMFGLVEPGAKAALTAAPEGPIAVLATRGTTKGSFYRCSIEGMTKGKVKAVEIACPDLVPLVEQEGPESERTLKAVRRYAERAKKEKAKAVILGCTHYALLAHAFEEALGEGVAIVDPARALAEEAANILGRRGEELSGPPEILLLCSGPAGRVVEYALRHLSVRIFWLRYVESLKLRGLTEDGQGGRKKERRVEAGKA